MLDDHRKGSLAPAGMPHKFENLGPGLLEQIDIHEAAQFKTVWLE